MSPGSFVRQRGWLAAIALLGCALGLALLSPPARAVTRDQVLARARAYALHPWRCTEANLTASCSSDYQSIYSPGDYLGLPYDWGGYMSLWDFDQQIAQGYGAGGRSWDGVLSCTAGLDCSGYVSKCWFTGHYSTRTLHNVSFEIPRADVLPGDAFNKSGSHVVLYSHSLANGDPIFYEAQGYNVHINLYGGWSYVSSYVPIRHNLIEGFDATAGVGSVGEEIEIGSFPFVDERDTNLAASDAFDFCNAASTTDESGPEFIYRVELTQPGTLTAAVADDVGVDIDVHLYSDLNTGDCLARDDSSLSEPLDCGTYYILADTYVGATGEAAGAYTLTVDFAPSGGSCGSATGGYAIGGHLGEACAFPGDESLPFCNDNFGADTCLFSESPPRSFCTRPCDSVADCDFFPDGCCAEIAVDEVYCLPADVCATADAGFVDSGSPSDAARGDLTLRPPDSSSGDLGQAVDGGALDAAGADARTGVGGKSGGGGDVEEGGCGCSARAQAPSWLLGLLGLVLTLRWRRRPK